MARGNHKGMAAFLQALAEPNRLQLLGKLATGSKNVTELAQLLGVEIVNVSHHLGVLRTAGMVTDEKHGRFVVYTLNAALKPVAQKGQLTLTYPDGGVSVTLDV